MQTVPSDAAMTSLDDARALLAGFDVADDADSLAFLADLLVTGAAPPDEVAALLEQAGHEPGAKQRRRRKPRKPPKPRKPRKERHTRGRRSGHDACAVSPRSGGAEAAAAESLSSEGGMGTAMQSVGKEPPGVQTPLRITGQAAVRTFAVVARLTVLGGRPVPTATDVPALPAAAKGSPSPAQKRETTSHFFAEAAVDDGGGAVRPPTPRPPPPRPPRPSRRGRVSGLPFPPLDAPRFGLVQELLANEPFWLLAALVFLTRVAGRVSLPVFWAVKARCGSSPRALEALLADTETTTPTPTTTTTLEQDLRHLGLARMRCAALGRLARRWLAQPPQAGVATAVKNYPPGGERGAAEEGRTSTRADTQWEIGHITQGAYAVDAWRIFCRDALLGKTPTNDDGRQAPDGGDDSQPEWMRVQPRDKELRAYLRWQWMRAGWDWDPRSGARTPLRDELRRAVNEGRVGYDADGRLQIVE